MDSAAKRLRENLNQAERRIQNAVCPIYGLDERDRAKLIGSSILLKVTAHTFLVTAAHVLDANKQTTLYVAGPERLVELTGSSYRTCPPASGRRDDTLDFGFIDVSETPISQWSRYHFTTPSNLDVDDFPVAHTLYGFVGFPETKNRPLLGRKLQLSTTAYVVIAGALERYQPLHLNPVVHFVGEFDRKNQVNHEMGLVTGPDPYGISGGGVWRMGRPEEFARGTNAEKLIGIGIEYRKPERILVGVRISLLLASLTKAFPEFAESLSQPARVRPEISGLR